MAALVQTWTYIGIWKTDDQSWKVSGPDNRQVVHQPRRVLTRFLAREQSPADTDAQHSCEIKQCFGISFIMSNGTFGRHFALILSVHCRIPRESCRFRLSKCACSLTFRQPCLEIDFLSVTSTARRYPNQKQDLAFIQFNISASELIAVLYNQLVILKLHRLIPAVPLEYETVVLVP
jgi:hypothetical protein